MLLRQSLLGKLGRVLFLLVGASFLLVALTACAGGGGGSGSSSGPGNTPGPGDNPGTDSPEEVKPGFTFAPIEGGFRIGNQSLDFGEFVSLNITATNVNSGEMTHANLSLAEFIDSSYDFLGLDDQSNYTFMIEGIFINGTRQEVPLVLVWEENIEDYAKGGLRPGLDTDGDRRANSVDLDDDNDGLADNHTREQLTNETSGTLCSLLKDCDDDGIGDRDEVASQCVVKSDCDDDDLLDTDERERLINSNDVSCTLLPDCDMDGIRDIYEEAECVIDPDCDGDRTLDGIDIDRDGDGLIELATAEQLDRVRYALDGTGRRAMGEMLNTSGCVGGDGNNSCSGYELIADIDIAAYIKDTYGTNGWQPLGHDTRASAGAECEGDKFDGTFEGNGRTIRGLDISRSDKNCVGLFGQLASGATIRNLTLIAEEVKGKDRVGVLVGTGVDTRIISSSVEAAKVSGRDDVGGLVGKGNSAQINSSSVVANEVSGSRDRIGGLVGTGQDARIVSSSVVVGEMSGDSNIGGLVGDGVRARIHSSSVVAGEMSGDSNIGGLIGEGSPTEVGSSTQIHSSSVVVGEVSGSGNNVGGLVGRGWRTQIHSSSVKAAKLSSQTENLGGLLGYGEAARIINSSVLVGEVEGRSNVGGLVGAARSPGMFQPFQAYSSSVVAGQVSGREDIGGLIGEVTERWTRVIASFAVVANVSASVKNVGGLIGTANDARIVSSFVVADQVMGNVSGGMLGTGSKGRLVSSFAVAREVSGGGGQVGGLVAVHTGGWISYSYLVIGNNDVSMLVAAGRAAQSHNSYWDRRTSVVLLPQGEPLGSFGKNTDELQMPTDYEDEDENGMRIYATWDDGVDLDLFSGVENITIWCDRDNSGAIEAAERRDDNRIWDFGTENEYPVVRCSSLSPAEIRRWWFLDGTPAKPQLNQTRLDEALEVLPSLD